MRQRPDLSAVPVLLSPAAHEKEPFPGQNDGVIASIRPMPSQLQAGTREPQPFAGRPLAGAGKTPRRKGARPYTADMKATALRFAQELQSG